MMLRQDLTRSRNQATSLAVAQQTDCAVRRAEEDYYACLTNFGHNSGEAHAAHQIWLGLRSRQQAQAA